MHVGLHCGARFSAVRGGSIHRAHQGTEGHYHRRLQGGARPYPSSSGRSRCGGSRGASAATGSVRRVRSSDGKWREIRSRAPDVGALAGVVRRRAMPPRSDTALQRFGRARGVRAERAATRVQEHQCRRAARQPGFRHRRGTVRPNVAWVQAVAIGVGAANCVPGQFFGA